MKILRIFCHLAFFTLVFEAFPVLAQNGAVGETFSVKGRAVDAATIRSDNRLVYLWGVQVPKQLTEYQRLAGFLAMDDILSMGPADCQVRGRIRNSENIIAFCRDRNGQDIALSMLESGHVIADRPTLENNPQQSNYIMGQTRARTQFLGLWEYLNDGSDNDESGEGLSFDTIVAVMLLIFLPAMCLIAILLWIVRQNLNAVSEIYSQNYNLESKEENLKVRERQVVSMMLGAELRGNKSKIEAFLLIYGELLHSLKDTSKPPRYQQAGDIVHEQPSLERTIYDSYADRISLLDVSLAGDLVTFYAQVNPNPEYLNLDPSMPLEEAVKLVSEIVQKAEECDQQLTNLVEQFDKINLSNNTSMMKRQITETTEG